MRKGPNRDYIQMRFRSKYEMETEFGVIEGSYEELVSNKHLFANATIFELMPSSMNQVKLTRRITMTLGQYLTIHRMHKLGRPINHLRDVNKCGDRLIMRILSDEFNILRHAKGETERNNG